MPALPLSLSIEDRAGHPAPVGRLALWIDAVRTTGNALAFLSWSRPAADNAGIWTGRNLPLAPLRAVAWRSTPLPQVESGALDVYATALPFPWNGGARLRSAD
jgi:hypothetical protein